MKKNPIIYTRGDYMEYKSDIEIAQSTELLPIDRIADKAGIDRNISNYMGIISEDRL